MTNPKVLTQSEFDKIRYAHDALYFVISQTDGIDLAVELNDAAREGYYGMHNLLGLLEKNQTTDEFGNTVYELTTPSA